MKLWHSLGVPVYLSQEHALAAGGTNAAESTVSSHRLDTTLLLFTFIETCSSHMGNTYDLFGMFSNHTMTTSKIGSKQCNDKQNSGYFFYLWSTQIPITLTNYPKLPLSFCVFLCMCAYVCVDGPHRRKIANLLVATRTAAESALSNIQVNLNV